jgi:hypothetical protein
MAILAIPADDLLRTTNTLVQEKDMKKLFLFVMFLFLLAGWALAAASLHVVRTEGPIPKVGGLTLVPKDGITYRGTYIDITGWTEAEVSAHPSLGRKLVPQARDGAGEGARVETGTFSIVTK